ncbi:MAG: hypothetical protein U0V74_00705 [Chitinophagales bacterium]
MTATKKVFFTPIIVAFLIMGLLTSCKKEVNNVTTTNNPNSSYFLKGNLGGESIELTAPNSFYTDETVVDNEDSEHCGEHHGPSHPEGDNDGDELGGDGDNDEDDMAVITSGSSWNTTGANNKMLTQGTIEVRGLVVRIWVNPAKAQSYFNLFTPGIHSFAYENGAKAGAYVTVRDSNGVLWTSKGAQEGSTFEVLTRSELKGNYTTVTGVVNCKLYDNKGNVKQFTNGAFSANVGIAN